MDMDILVWIVNLLKNIKYCKIPLYRYNYILIIPFYCFISLYTFKPKKLIKFNKKFIEKKNND